MAFAILPPPPKINTFMPKTLPLGLLVPLAISPTGKNETNPSVGSYQSVGRIGLFMV
jgi:hypothetical protein